MNTLRITFPDDVDWQQIEGFLRDLQHQHGQGTMEGALVSFDVPGFTQTEFDGVTYGIQVTKNDGVTNVRFTADPPPQGHHRIRYEWTGRLTTTNRESKRN